jgi:predicted ArsR family transcriptional regulator
MSFERRQLTSATELRALGHPVRLALMELLDEQGPLTATAAGELLGESPANASFHLRTLAKYGYVEEAEGGRGRQRPWQLVPRFQEIHGDELGPEARRAAGALVQVLRERDNARLRTYDASRADYPKPWRDAANEIRASLHLTVEELAEFTQALETVVERYMDIGAYRTGRPGSLPISFGLHAIPTRPPATPTESPEDQS